VVNAPHELTPRVPPLQHDAPSGIEADDMETRFADVNANGRDLHGRSYFSPIITPS
jgi:hypothetical protein